MRPMLLFTAAVLSFTTWTAAPAPAQETSWEGKRVFLKQKGIRIGHTGDDGRQVYVATLSYINYRVLADKEGWLQVSHNGVRGWFDKNLAVVQDDAVAYFSDIIRRNPRDDQAYNRRAIAYRLLGNYESAIRDLTRAIEIDPDASWYGNRGYTWLEMGQFQKAIDDYDQSLRINARNTNVYTRRGWGYVCLKQYDRALADFNTALRLDPKFSAAYVNRGVVWERKGQYDKALEDMNRAYALDPENDYTLSRKAWLLATADDPAFRNGKEAVTLARKGCELDGWIEAWQMDILAAACAEAGDFQEAVHWQQKALQDAKFAEKEGAEARARLKLYQAGKPYHQAPERQLANADAKSKTEPVPQPAPETWVEFKAPDGSFTIDFPGKPLARQQKLSSGVGRVVNYSWSVSTPDNTYLVSYFDLPGDALLTLDASVKAYLTARKGTLVSAKDLRQGAARGKEFTVRLEENQASRVRLYEVGARRYQLVVEGPEANVTSADADRFMNSFKTGR